MAKADVLPTKSPLFIASTVSPSSRVDGDQGGWQATPALSDRVTSSPAWVGKDQDTVILEFITTPAQLSLVDDIVEGVKDGSECEEVKGKEAHLVKEEFAEKAKSSSGNVRLLPTRNSCSDFHYLHLCHGLAVGRPSLGDNHWTCWIDNI